MDELEGSVSKDGTKEDEKHIRDLAFLSMTSMGFLELSPEDDIYEFIAEQLKKLSGDSFIVVSSFDEATDYAYCREVLGVGEKMGIIISILGKHPVGMSLKIDNEAKLGLTSGKLVKVPNGFYEFCYRKIPRTVCRTIEKVLDLGDIYAMGFAWKGNLFGNASILTRKGTPLADQTVIETFIHQASVALQRRQVEQALQKAHDELETRVEERTRELAEANAQMFVEMTERKKMERKLHELITLERDKRFKLETEEKERLQFFNALAHELKTPLTAVVASAGLLIEEIDDKAGSPRIRLAENIIRSIHKLEARLSELLDMARIGTRSFELNFELLDIRPIIQNVVGELLPIAVERKQALITEIPSTLPMVKADKQRFEQILINLVNNAIKFTGEGDKIYVRARKKDDRVMVEVEDHGPGITKEEQARIFQPYYRIEADRQRFSGLGLGLALSKQLVKMHKGRMWVRSKVGKGSTFIFTLPVAEKGKASTTSH